MLSDFKDLFLILFASQEAAYFAAVLQAIATVGAAIYGLFSFNKWIKQRSIEKCSDYAEAALNLLDSAHERLMDLGENISIPDWNKKYNESKAEFGQARRKAHRLGDSTIDANLKIYEEALLSFETIHHTMHDALITTKDSHGESEVSKNSTKLKNAYENLYNELLEKSLIPKH